MHIYIYGRVSWYYILSITSQGAPKSTRALIYIYIVHVGPGPGIQFLVGFVKWSICQDEVASFCMVFLQINLPRFNVVPV